MIVTNSDFVDFQHLVEELDADCASELVAAFLDDTSATISQLEEAAAHHDHERLRSTSHMLKGCCRSISAYKCESAASKLEKLAMDKNWADVPSQLTEVSTLYQQTVGDIRKYLGQ